MNSHTLISLKDVCWHAYGQNIIQNVSLDIHEREILTLIGPNGAGKTTLVDIVVGLKKPSHGRVERNRNLRIGYMPQHLRFDNTLPITVERFLRLSSSDKTVLQHFSDQLGISHLLPKPLRTLSGGEMQRVLLTRACLRKPQLLVLDEPTQGVDVGGQAELYGKITELRDELNCGVLMVSHDLLLVMAQTDTVICLNRHMCCHGEPLSVAQHPEYQQLFGKETAAQLALYQHAHDHDHDMHGDVVDAEGHTHSPGCQHGNAQ